MDTSELLAVLERYPELKAGLPNHVDELFRIAERIIEMESRAVRVPELPVDAPEWERAYWRKGPPDRERFHVPGSPRPS